GQVTGQPALAVVTIPTATLAALPGLTAAAPAAALFKAPVANVTALRLPLTPPSPPDQGDPPPPELSEPLPSPCQEQAAAVLSPTISTIPGGPPQPPGQPPLLPNPPPEPTPPKDPTSSVQPHVTGLTFNPGILTAALGTQPQLLGSLSAPPVITSPLPGQLLTNAQGQVIGTLPWVVAPPSVATASPAPAAPSLQVTPVTPVTPQLLLNAQGQVIATLTTGTTLATATTLSTAATLGTTLGATLATVPAPPAPSKKNGAPEPPPTPTVSQLVSKPPNPPSAEEDGINLEEIREFAKNFKLRRLSLGLTQTQVGQALTATEGPAYSQSAICRFEKLDITPKSAQKLKPVLEKWLREAEQRQREGQQHLLDFVGGEPGKKRKRRTSFTPQALEALNAHFERNALPTGPEITRIAQELRYDREVVRVWFCNRRQTLKNTSKLNVFHVP
ncbi:PO6F1 factor, partial [Pitta sordida]|nr:PO6F1 factor [Pitta sordida]